MDYSFVARLSFTFNYVHIYIFLMANKLCCCCLINMNPYAKFGPDQSSRLAAYKEISLHLTLFNIQTQRILY